MEDSLKCPIRGHNHDCRPVGRTLVQDGTGMKARTFECPTGYYRWLVIEDNTNLKRAPKFKRPRWGWNSLGVEK